MKGFLLFIGGAIVGVAGGVLGSKKYFETKFQKRYEDDKSALEGYYKRTDEYSRNNSDDCDENEEEENTTTETTSRPSGRMSSEERATIKEKLNKNWEGTTNYAGMYKKHNDQNETNKVEVESEEPNPDEEAFDYHQKNKDKPPKIISADAYSNLPAYIDQEVLYFYAMDEVLCDDNEEILEEPERFVGDALTKFGFIDNDESIIFVMNYELDTCYEIQKVYSSWHDVHYLPDKAL